MITLGALRIYTGTDSGLVNLAILCLSSYGFGTGMILLLRLLTEWYRLIYLCMGIRGLRAPNILMALTLVYAISYVVRLWMLMIRSIVLLLGISTGLRGLCIVCVI